MYRKVFRELVHAIGKSVNWIIPWAKELTESRRANAVHKGVKWEKLGARKVSINASQFW